MRKVTSLLLLTALSSQSLIPASSFLETQARASESPESDPPSPCMPTQELSLEERDAFYLFNALLSHLASQYGKAGFERALEEIIEKKWPKTKLIQVSPVFFEQVQNLVDQARLKDSIARTIGLDHPAWNRFERLMRNITLHHSIGADLLNPFEKVSQGLLRELHAARLKNTTKAEAILRVAQMYAYLVRWRGINRGIIQDRAEASVRSTAILAIGLLGAGMLTSTLVVSGPVVSGAGVLAGGLSADPMISTLLVKLGEAAAGSAIGFYGSPGAQLVKDSYQTLTEAAKESANAQTNYNCELTKQSKLWKSLAGEKLFSAALSGATLGAGGAALTFTSRTAKLVLYGTSLGVGVAQLYSLGKLSASAVESVGYYQLAEEAEASGDHAKALEMLHQARDLAQEAGEQALESIIIGTLTHHVAKHFMHALQDGESAIRQLYAASADTIPTAENAVEQTVKAATEGLTGGRADDGQ